MPDGVRGRGRPGLDRQGAPTRPSPCARRPRPRSSRRPRRWPTAAPRRWCPAARPARRWPPGCSTCVATAGSIARRWPCPSRCRAPPGAAARRGRQRHLPARAPGPVRAHGLGLRPAVMGSTSPGGAALQRRGAGKGTPELVAVHEQLAGEGGTGLNFVGNIEGTQVTDGAADVDRHGRVHRQHHPEADRGRLGPDAARDPRRGDGLDARQARRLAARPAVRRLRDEIDPEGPGGAYMLGLRQLGVVAHGRFSRRGFPRAIEVAARGVRRTSSAPREPP